MTHLISDNLNSELVQKVIINRENFPYVKIVRVDWLLKCIQKGRFIKEHDYLLK